MADIMQSLFCEWIKSITFDLSFIVFTQLHCWTLSGGVVVGKQTKMADRPGNEPTSQQLSSRRGSVSPLICTFFLRFLLFFFGWVVSCSTWPSRPPPRSLALSGLSLRLSRCCAPLLAPPFSSSSLELLEVISNTTFRMPLESMTFSVILPLLAGPFEVYLGLFEPFLARSGRLAIVLLLLDLADGPLLPL